MDKILLIVDPQVDFISGSLAVEGAKEKMDALASALQNGEIDCDYVMVTKDFHPSNHCSFKENGGQWPPHCVKGTAGSCVYAPLWSVINNYAYRKDTDIFIKGDSPDKEEYSIFDNLESLSVISDILLDFESDPDNVSLVYVPTIRMCSTCIRNRVKDGVGIKPFVRDDVYEIIKQYKLYV